MNITEIRKHSYVPYSGKPTAALVRSKKGEWFPGVRIENIAYPLSISATQNALFCCLSEGAVPEELFTDEFDSTVTAFWEKEFNVAVHRPGNTAMSDLPGADIAMPATLSPKKKLVELLDMAIVGESNFPVSALVETELGFFNGVNIECPAWNMGLCAERVAIAKAITYGSKKFRQLHIHTREGEFSSPCGSCRQVILEHMPNRQIHLHHADHSESVHFSNDLLPHSFSSSSFLKS